MTFLPSRIHASKNALISATLALLMMWPMTSNALQLKWGNGSTSITANQATRSRVILLADSASALPTIWRLTWVADTSGLQFSAADSLVACETDTSKVSAIDPPSTAVDTIANQTSAHFCSEDNNSAEVAYFYADIVGGSKGKIKVVALLDGADPDSVIESNEITYNGGIGVDYPPTPLRATSEHTTALLQVTVVGSGLDDVHSVSIGADDRLWKVSLAIDSQSATRLTASDSISAELPQAVIELQTAEGVLGAVGIDADPMTAMAMVSSTVADTIFYRDPNPRVYPHDFAFYYNSVPNPTDPVHPWKGAFHLFYIRTVVATQADSIIAHAWCDTLGAAWKVDTLAFRPSNLGWDKKKVWAPDIHQIGNLYYMFYTGVDSLGNQSIGYATTPMLGTTNISWTRRKTPIYTPFNTSWADTVGTEVTGVRQFRDGFVMPDPAHDGRYLMFNVAEDRTLAPKYVVGVSRNVAGTFNSWVDGGKYPSTDWNHLGVSRVESPLVVRDSLSGAWRMFVANANYDPQGFKSTYFLTQAAGDSVTNTSVSAWPQRDSLFAYLGNDQSVVGWQACEHLQIGDVHFFAAYVGPDGIGITRMHWDSNAHKFFFVHPTNVGVVGQSNRNEPRFYVSGLRPGARTVRFVLETPRAFIPKLGIYDLAGRRVRTLSDGRLVEGRREFVWDSRRDDGGLAAAGVYFALLTGQQTSLVVRVPLIR